jgi:DNA replication protein DnaC
VLSHPTLEKLHILHLTGMVKALAEQLERSDLDELGFVERLGLLVDREMTERESRRLKYRLDKSHLPSAAVAEDVDFRIQRGLDRALFLTLCSSQWIRDHLNILITGSTGSGKSFLACALAHKACRDGLSVAYHRLPRLLPELAIAKADGRYAKILANLARTDLLVLDDWGLLALTDNHRRDLLEILEDRYGRRSTIVTSQWAIKDWHESIGDPTLADAILDRLVHNAHRLALNCKESIRKQRALRQHTDQ